MFWLWVGIAVLLFLAVMWRLDRRGSRGRSRLGWSSTRWTDPQKPALGEVPPPHGDNSNGAIPGGN